MSITASICYGYTCRFYCKKCWGGLSVLSIAADNLSALKFAPEAFLFSLVFMFITRIIDLLTIPLEM
ncbi:hypothetical protein CLV42_111161 [Chitinophaga ginsengisoli]|uniref:Uncharacterized protein n=1 Tax=Chitinophaga ginsengisoli TaxID=363837 RepID=A0A2P8FXJ9_9BACT|nr:hypothetical protein CLV42_111161 [Chitinophaga ginsengisoli]